LIVLKPHVTFGVGLLTLNESSGEDSFNSRKAMTPEASYRKGPLCGFS
jgi:hypothetical protein